MTMRNKNILYIILCLLTLVPMSAKAQLGFDVVSVEAYINDHKEQRSLLLVRSTLEASNKLLHDYSSDANIGYKDINKELDKYTRAFDVIDILYQSLRTSLNVYNTYETVSDRVADYKKMLNDFNEKCLSRGNIVTTDTLLITINARALSKIADEGDNLYKVCQRSCAICDRGCSLFDKRPPDSPECHQQESGQYQEASEYSLLRDVEIYTGSHRLLEGSGLSRQDDERDC